MEIKEIIFSNFGEFLNAVLPNGSIGKSLNGYIYRGEGSSKYKLLPTALRETNIDKLRQQVGPDCFKLNDTEWLQIFAEYRILKKFYVVANNSGLKVHGSEAMARHYFDEVSPEVLFRKEMTWIEPDVVELAALAQHHGALTRMLDWSSDLLVSLYFSCVGSMKRLAESQDDFMVIWALDSYHIQIEEQHIYTLGKETCPLKVVVPPYYSNRNLKAQKGVLTYWKVNASMQDSPPVDRTPLNELIQHVSIHQRPMYKFNIPNKYSPEVYEWLKRLGISAATIYPGYRGVVQQMEEDALYLSVKRTLDDFSYPGN